MQRINPELILPDKIALEIESIKYHDFEVETSNAREGTLHLSDGVVCEECKNKGIIFERKNGAVFAKKCQCATKRHNLKLIKDSGLDDLIKHRINDFKATEEWQIEIKKLAVDFATSNFEKRWFVILGQSGIGKTMICSAIARKFIEDGKDTRYCVWGILAKELKRNVMSDGYNKLYNEIAQVNVLYIDDFLKGSITEVDKNYAFDLINDRYNNNKITIISSERLFEDLMDIDSAVAGRIKQKAGRYMIQIEKDEAKNYRLK